jgi:hypothetical protein
VFWLVQDAPTETPVVVLLVDTKVIAVPLTTLAAAAIAAVPFA